MESTYFNLHNTQKERTKYEANNNEDKRGGKGRLERISTSPPSEKTPEQLEEEIMIREKIKKWKEKFQVVGDILEVYYRWKGKI